MGGRPPKPTALLLLTGADKKNPQRMKDRAAEPQPPAIPVGDPPADFMIQSPDVGYQRAERMRAIWFECLEMWPWVTYSDRFTLESICRLKVKERIGTISTGELASLARFVSSVGGDGTGRARLGKRGVGESSDKPAKVDPRAKFMRAG